MNAPLFPHTVVALRNRFSEITGFFEFNTHAIDIDKSGENFEFVVNLSCDKRRGGHEMCQVIQ